MADWLQKQWRGYSLWHVVLLPLSWVFYVLSALRRALFRCGILVRQKLAVPVIVVGNISVGGTGKTPLVIWLAAQLKLAGFKPGIISRGYGGVTGHITEVLANSLADQVGDEPLLMARRTQCPVFVGAHRVDAGRALLKAHPEVNVILSDDGLQHYRLKRDIEIAVLDAQRGFGNAQLLPAGPLRENIQRLNSVDAIVINKAGHSSPLKASLLAPVFDMQLSGQKFISLLDGKTQQPPQFFTGKSLVAVAGIGNPQRFFDALSQMGLVFERTNFQDHQPFSAQDLLAFAGKTILMTEKDAVKCEQFASRNAQYDIWVLPVSANIDHELNALVLRKLLTISKGK